MPPAVHHPNVPDPPTERRGRELSLDGVALHEREPEELLGRTMTSIVERYEITHDGQPLSVAVKRPPDYQSLGRRVFDQYQRELEQWLQLDDHPHVVEVYDHGTEPRPWIAMEYMDGGTLRDRIDPESSAERLGLDQRLWIAHCLASTLEYVHEQGVTHFDLKPQNILFRRTDSGLWDFPMIGDWEYSRQLLEHSDSGIGGTLAYAAPEQPHGDTGKHTDVYQLGAVLYELFTDQELVASVKDKATVPRPLTSAEPSLPSALDDPLLAALQPEIEDRCTAGTLATELRRLVERRFPSGFEGWPMFRGGPANRGVTLNETGPHDGLDVRWTFPTGAPITASPVVADGVVYVASQDGNLYALDSASGNFLDAFATWRRHYATPTVRHGRLFLNPGTIGDCVDTTVELDDREHRLLAVDTAFESSAALPDVGEYTGSSPTFHADLGYIGADGQLVAFDRDGKRWTVSVDGSIVGTPAVVRGGIYFATSTGQISALDASDGTEWWSQDISTERLLASVVAGDGTLVVPGGEGTCYGYELDDGTLRWSLDFGAPINSSPAVHDGDAVLGCDDGTLYWLDLESGDITGQFGTDEAIRSSPATDGRAVYVGSDDGCVYAVDFDTGDELGRFDTGNHVVSSPAIANDGVYVGNRDGVVYAFE